MAFETTARPPDADRVNEPGGTLPEAAAASNRDKLMMLIATGARMSVGLFTFMLLARYLGPAQFGVIATAMAYAMLVGLTTDFGLTVSALRKASIERERAAYIVGDAIAVKAILATIALCIAALAIALLVPPDHMAVFGLIFLGTVANSMADLMMVVVRANRRFDIEARLVVGTSFAMLAIVGGTAALTQDVVYAAAAFALTRFGYLVAVFTGLRQWLGAASGFRRSRAEIWSTLRESSSYALDNMLTAASNQIDVLTFALFLSAKDIGVYQAGARLVQVIVPFAVVLSTVYMPVLSSAAARPADGDFRRLSNRVSAEFAVLALIGAAMFVLIGPVITRHFYGPAYRELLPLWAGFGVYALLRFAAAGFGIQLIALGRISTRIISQVTALAVFGVATLLLLPRFGPPVSSWLLGILALPSFLILGIALARSGRASKIVYLLMAALLIVAGGFAWLHV